MGQHRRESDNSALSRWYYNKRPQVHIAELLTMAMILFSAVATFVHLGDKVEAHEIAIKTQDQHLDKLDQAIAAQTATEARIEQKVDDVRYAVRTKTGR